MNVPFAKMHGIGNDFILIDRIAHPGIPVDVIERNAPFLCDRHFGIGSDGILVVEAPTRAGIDLVYRMYNPDGSEAEMCGNGIRCFGKWVFENGHTYKRTITVETKAGDLVLELNGDGDIVDSVRVDMGPARLSRPEIPMTGAEGPAVGETLDVDGRDVAVTAVSMGNPHAVYFVDTVTDESINSIGPVLEKHYRFPRKTNVHEVQVLSPSHLHMLTWERGAGRTLACGTGACSVAVAAHLNGYAGRSANITLAGGDLQILWDEATNHVFMTGPATLVYTGSIELN
ncbi:MAG: diaminopimelate epimerase [Armatimonadota bacterium]